MVEAQTRVRVRVPTPVEPVVESADFDSIIGQVNARMGANVMRKATAVPGMAHIDTGIFMLDMALLGGIPEGHSTMLYGYESSGKTTLAIRIAAALQRKYPDKRVVYFDCEHTYNNIWAAIHGVDNSRMYIVQPSSGEELVDVVDAVLQTKDCAAIVIDSLPTIIPMKESESSAEDAMVALRARLVGRMCSKILAAQTKMRTAENGFAPTKILINQWRTKIGVVKGDPRVLPCGAQPKFLCTTMLELKNKEELVRNSKGIEIVKQNNHTFVVKKSRVGNSVRQAEFTMVRDPENPLGEGTIDDFETVTTYAKKFGLVTGGGSSWRIDGIDKKFGKLEQIEDFFIADEEEFLIMKRRLIMAQRLEMGLLAMPPDGYLCGWCEA